MTYELALKLKEAGFKQSGDGKIARFLNKQAISDYTGLPIEPLEALYFPTLEELIEECGYRFLSLDRHEGGCFVAVALADSLTSFIKTENANRTISPSEAVANLWLSLYNK